MVSVMNNNNCSIWLKPVFKCMDKIVECRKSKKIKYSEIQTGNIISLEFNDAKRTYIATGNWDKNSNSCSFINLHGRHIVLSLKALKDLDVCLIGSLVV